MAVKHGPRKAESSPGELIHRFGELDIELRQSAGIVCRQGYIDGFVDVGPFWVMVELFRNQSRARHKPERFIEVPEDKFPGDGIAPRTSRQPLSRASPDLRASPESFSAISALYLSALVSAFPQARIG